MYYFGARASLFFLPGSGEEGNVAYAYIQKTRYFHAFFDKDHLLSFSAKRKNIIFSGINKYHLCRYFKKDRVQAQISWKDYFPEHLNKMSYFQVFSLRTIIFPHNTRSYSSAIFFGKNVFSKHLEKENMVFRTVCVENEEQNLSVHLDQSEERLFRLSKSEKILPQHRGSVYTTNKPKKEQRHKRWK